MFFPLNVSTRTSTVVSVVSCAFIWVIAELSNPDLNLVDTEISYYARGTLSIVVRASFVVVAAVIAAISRRFGCLTGPRMGPFRIVSTLLALSCIGTGTLAFAMADEQTTKATLEGEIHTIAASVALACIAMAGVAISIGLRLVTDVSRYRNVAVFVLSATIVFALGFYCLGSAEHLGIKQKTLIGIIGVWLVAIDGIATKLHAKLGLQRAVRFARLS